MINDGYNKTIIESVQYFSTSCIDQQLITVQTSVYICKVSLEPSLLTCAMAV